MVSSEFFFQISQGTMKVFDINREEMRELELEIANSFMQKLSVIDTKKESKKEICYKTGKECLYNCGLCKESY